jgi:hypothetical protein
VSIPSLRQAKQALALKDRTTVCCQSCKKPLWELSDIHQYGTKTGAHKKSLCGSEWSDYWEKDNRTPKRIDCPYCHEDYLGAIQGPNETLFPKFWILEIDGVT